MRQVKILALMTALSMTLCGCAQGQSIEEKAIEIQKEYSAWESLDITAEVTADYGNRVYEFKLKYTGNDSEGTVEVLKPEELGGLTARISPDSSSLIYDGAELYLGELTADGLSPMDCIPMMIGQWSDGYIQDVVRETIDGTDTLAVTFTASEDVSITTWFEEDTNLPVKAEIYYDNSMVLWCEFENIVT